LKNLTQLAEMGAVILPPVPAFYAEPHSLSDMVDQMAGRMLDVFGYDWPSVRRWGEDLSKGRRKTGSRQGRS
jgi:4-hydroxy-3-polyprenylbenzoate decarboxylase